LAPFSNLYKSAEGEAAPFFIVFFRYSLHITTDMQFTGPDIQQGQMGMAVPVGHTVGRVQPKSVAPPLRPFISPMLRLTMVDLFKVNFLLNFLVFIFFSFYFKNVCPTTYFHLFFLAEKSQNSAIGKK
jgi:hypothetical protein